MTGVITDQSGAAVPRATVTVRDEATGFIRTTTGNDTGNYNLPGLRPASYDVVVECQGFRRYSQKAFQVQVSQAARLDIQLEVGEVTQQIEVSGTTQLLHTENATVGAAIGTKEITDLPLNGRNFVQLALLVPGVNTGQPGAGSGGGISIGGARSEQNAFQLDGVSNSDQWDNNIVFRPNIDSIQEFKIEVSNYAAEFGTGAGGQINVVTKSGTNQYHGSLYEFLRNNAVQANNFFQRDPNFRDKNGKFVAPPFKQNQFGGSLGGPIVHNRTFYWVDYEGLRRVRGQTGLKTVPNAALKAGDFSSNLGNQIGTDALGRAVFANEIFDPLSSRNVTDSRTGRIVSLRDQFPGNRLPVSRFDPIAAKVLQKGLWPDPNTAGARDRVTGNPIQNYADGRNLRDNDNQFSTRVDHQFSDRDTVFGRYNFFDHDGRDPGNFPGMERLSPVRQHVLSTSYTKTLSPTRVNEFRFGYQRVNAQAAGALFLSGQNLVKEFGVLGLPLAPPGAPDFTVSGFTNISSGGELVRQNDTFQILDQFSFNKGRHFFKIGFEARRVMQGVVNNPARTRGEFILENPEWTGIEGIPGAGNTFANFLLGLSQRKGRRPGDHASDLRAAEYAAFFQDDFKVSSRLTVNYGVRYQLYIPPKDTKNRISGVRLTNPPASFQQGGIYYCKDPARCAALSPNLPTLGLGLTLNDLQVDRLPQFVIAGQQVPRSLTDVETKDFGPRFGAAYRLAPNTVIRTGYGIFYDTFRMNYFQDSVENIPFVREDLQTLSPFQWGLPPAEAIFGFLLNDPPINSITPGPNGFNLDFRNAYVQNWNFGVQHQVKNDLVLEVSYVGSKGTRLNYRVARDLAEPRGNAVIPASVHPQLRRLVPFAIFDNQLITLSNWFSTTSYGFSTYHALMGRFEKRFAGGLTYINSFTWSKSITNGAPVSGGSNDTGNRPQDMFNLSAEKALAPNDHKFRFVSSIIYDLPFGKGKHLASGVNPILNQVIGGWQVNGIATFQSGYPVNVRRPGDPLGIGTDSAARPDLVCNPNMPGGDRTISHYFRTECFSAPADRFGNAGRTTVIGPGLNLWDLAVNKNFAVREKAQVQFRAEFFNAFNHPNWNLPGRDFGASAFGVVSSALDPRIIQFGLKLLF